MRDFKLDLSIVDNNFEKWFKEEESLTVWISDDDNRIPVRVKASLAVGSLKADLEAFKGLKNSFKVIAN